MPNGNGSNHEEGVRFERGPSAAAAGLSYEREMVLESKGEEYKAVQMKIIKMEADLAKGNERALNEKNPKARELAIMIGRQMNQELEVLQAEKERLEQDIQNSGGNPSNYTVQ
jgi:hypothetical protein